MTQKGYSDVICNKIIAFIKLIVTVCVWTGDTFC